MSRFITFYSYKGGVGRTLALANVAWLLANNPLEPMRVLVIDFDLGAPGLHRVFNMPDRSHSLGVVDYVLQYLDTAKVPDISSFIQPTDYERIDIIPAGRMDRYYQKRLEGINWTSIYSMAHGYHLIESLKKSISSCEPEYDYVLIDSLTGYSDVGGICVNQIPDNIILIFRLNQQNLDGIGNVYSSVKKSSGKGEPTPAIPVISPAWPFIDEKADIWVKKALKIFGKTKLLEISFDSSLSFGEKIVSKTSKNLSLTSKVISDYRRLVSSIRDLNRADPLTLWKDVQESIRYPSEGTLDVHLKLLKKRPNKFQYWRALPQTSFASRVAEDDGDKTENKLQAFINEQCQLDNPYALFTRATFTRVFQKQSNDPLPDLNRAIEVKPDFYEAYIVKARELERIGRPFDAISTLDGLFSSLEPSDKRRSVVAEQIAESYLAIFDSERAAHYLGIAKKIAMRPSLFALGAKILYLEGKYEEALLDNEQSSQLIPDNERIELLKTQILAAANRHEEAQKILESIEKTYDNNDANLAEAYLAINPAKTLDLIENKVSKSNQSIVETIRSLALILLGKPVPNKDVTKITDDAWDNFEIVGMLKAKMRSNILSEQQISQLESYIPNYLGINFKVIQP